MEFFSSRRTGVFRRLALLGLIVLNAGCYQEVAPSPEMAVRMLTELLSDRDASVRRTAAEALGKIGRPSAEQSLVPALDDADPGVREAAARGLGRLPSVGIETGAMLTSRLRDSDPSVRQAAAQALDASDDFTVLTPRLADLLSDPRPEVRRSGAHALMLTGASRPAVNQALARAAQDPDSTVRQWVVAALGESDAAGSGPLLVNRLIHDPAEAVRAEAAYRLRYSEDGEVVTELETMGTRDKNDTVARWAQHSLTALKTVTGSGSAPPPSPPAATERSRQYP